jgi:hypothetical protein
MRKLTLALAAISVIGFALPVVSAAQAETIIIKKRHYDNGRHLGWRHHNKKVVVIQERRRHGEWHRYHRDHDGARVSIKAY